MRDPRRDLPGNVDAVHAAVVTTRVDRYRGYQPDETILLRLVVGLPMIPGTRRSGERDRRHAYPA